MAASVGSNPTATALTSANARTSRPRTPAFVDYRLDRVRALPGFDVADARARFTLHVAVVGARLIGWPDVPAHPLTGAH